MHTAPNGMNLTKALRNPMSNARKIMQYLYTLEYLFGQNSATKDEILRGALNKDISRIRVRGYLSQLFSLMHKNDLIVFRQYVALDINHRGISAWSLTNKGRDLMRSFNYQIN